MGNTFNIVAFTTYWLMNKSSLHLGFRRMVPTLGGFAGGKLRPENVSETGSGAPLEEDDDTFALLESGASTVSPMGGGSSSPTQPPPGMAAEPFEHDPVEVTSGPLMISFTRPSWQCAPCAPRSPCRAQLWPRSHTLLRSLRAASCRAVQ